VPNLLHTWIFFNIHPAALRSCRPVTREPLVAPSLLQGRAQLVATAIADAWDSIDACWGKTPENTWVVIASMTTQIWLATLLQLLACQTGKERKAYNKYE